MRPEALDWIVLGAVVVLSAWFLAHTRDYGLDDSYITYRYSQNIELGHGPVFNPGERFLGTSAPGFALLLACLHWLVGAIASFFSHFLRWSPGAPDIPHLARFTSAVSVGVIALTSYALIAKAFPEPPGKLSGLLVAVSIAGLPAFARVSGHETLTWVAPTLMGFALWRTRRSLAYAMLGAATVVRADATFAFLILGACDVAETLRNRRESPRPSLRSMAWFIGPTVAWVSFAWWFYGSPLPGTLAAKRAEAVLGYWPAATLPTLLSHVLDSLPALAQAPLLLLAACGAVAVAGRRDTGLLVAAWGITHLVVYSSLGITFWPWYGTPLVVVFLILAGYGGAAAAVALFGSRMAKAGPAPSAGWSVRTRTAYTAAGLLAALGMACWAFQQQPLTNPHLHSFDELISYVRRHSPDGASIATPEPGVIGFALGPRYRVVDTLGLVSPGVIAGRPELAYVRDAPEWALVSYGPRIQADLDGPPFDRWYREVARFTHPYWSAQQITLRLYRRSASSRGWRSQGGLVMRPGCVQHVNR